MRARSAKTLERARNRTSDNMTRGVDGEAALAKPPIAALVRPVTIAPTVARLT